MDEHAALIPVSLSRSQAHLLEQLNDEEFWRYATELAASSSWITEQAENHLLCDLGKRRCVFPGELAREIIPPPHQVTLLPAAPAWMPGLTTWRGEIIALVDLKAYLWDDAGARNTAPSTTPPPDLLFVIQAHNYTLGLLVTAITKTMSYEEGHMIPFELAPDWCSELRPRTIRGIQGDALVIDVPFVFNDIIQQIKEYSPQ